jgi:hypothetical protein
VSGVGQLKRFAIYFSTCRWPRVHSREVVMLDCCPKGDGSSAYFLDRGEVTWRCSLYKKYMERPEEFEDVSFLDYLLHYNHCKFKKQPRARPCVVSYFPGTRTPAAA